jgi:hypothetical protein
MIRLLDSGKLKKLVLATLEADGISTSDVEVEQMAILRTKYDEVAVLCTEGVGWTTSKESGALPIMVWSQWHQNFVYLPEAYVLSCVTDEVVDLADFVRVFGARLENNFHIWLNATDGVEQVFEKKVGV